LIIALFVKPPIPGRVKTRLARNIGDEAACSIYRRLAGNTIQQIRASEFPLALFFDGDDPSLLPQSWLEAASICLFQQGDDLGSRMAHAFTLLFKEGFKQAVLLGSDIPGIDALYLHTAMTQLASHDMVIGPALDGGYCLIGFHQSSFTESVFQNIPWSTDQVLNLTLNAAKQAGLSVGHLSPLHDIDTVEDLQYYNPSADITD
jgi:rSAM/selenodomain-associated transferase 1